MTRFTQNLEQDLMSLVLASESGLKTPTIKNCSKNVYIRILRSKC